MKLIVCRECFDTLALARQVRRCQCGKSAGVYVDDVRAQVTGPCTAFGLHSFDIGTWLRRTARGEYPEAYHGEVRAWAMPEHPTNIERVDALAERAP